MDKSERAKKEEEVLKFWQENNIFEKSLEKPSPKGEYVFYEGPPTANGRPGIHHLEARAFKDAIPRYKTMRGYHVRRKGGWDTHGLPVELEVERQLGFKSKKDIEQFGIAAFNEKCKESVWNYVDEWQQFTDRIGYWVDQKNPYVTYTPEYIESLWWIVSEINKRGLLYKDYKVLPWCPRCGTALSSHELAQGYEEVKDTALFVKFKIVGFPDAYFIAWTTTPWTLPGNVALAVGEEIEYVEAKVGKEIFVLAKERLSILPEPYEIIAQHKGKEMLGMQYEPLYPYTKELATGAEKEKLANAYKIYAADFVTTTDGSGIVHTAVMYGTDDFALGTNAGLPKVHVIDAEGKFLPAVEKFAGQYVKDVDVEVIKDLHARGLLFKKESLRHTYPHCWRCKTPLIYFARDSWYIAMSKLRDELVRENEKINWEPAHIKEGRFGEWLREVKDWAISRERYWATPLPVWECSGCKKIEVVGSIDELKHRTKKSGNTYFVMRHGTTVGNGYGAISYGNEEDDHLTDEGRGLVEESGKKLRKEKIDLIVTSPFARTQETAELVARVLGIPADAIVYDERLREMNVGEFAGTTWPEYHEAFPKTAENFVRTLPGGESYMDVKLRMTAVLEGLEAAYRGKRILIVTHGGPAWLLSAAIAGKDIEDTLDMIRDKADYHYLENAQYTELDFTPFPHNARYELDLHRPYIDGVTWDCECGGTFSRVKEVMDVWFDSGSMPFAQDPIRARGSEADPASNGASHWPVLYPADFISEGTDQTRGWFYTLLAVGVLLNHGTPYKNVISVGLVLDSNGKKMSKSLGNAVNIWEMVEKYGADVLRFWMYSVNQPGDSKNFDEKTVDEVQKKVFTILRNVIEFYTLYKTSQKNAELTRNDAEKSPHILDKWIFALRDKLVADVTEGFDHYDLFSATRALKDFVTDLSQWYVRRSRDRFKEEGEDREFAAATLKTILTDLAKLLAPFAPFFAEEMYKAVGGEKESVHLEHWPELKTITDSELRIIEEMKKVREIVSLALEQRSRTGIKVRQPLKTLTIRNPQFEIEQYLDLIKDEVNVKEVAAGQDFLLDTTITPELLLEGKYRDLVREVQDLRKEKGLRPGELVALSLPERYKEILAGLEDEFKKTVSTKSVSFSGERVSLEI